MLFKKLIIKKKILTASALLLSLTLAGLPVTAAAKVEDDGIYTEEGFEDYAAELARNKAQAVQTNLDPAWPHGPAIGAAGAVVMDAESGAVLYGKNIDKQLYPASITKLMTALLAYENLKPSDTVTFSENAVFGIERGSSNIGMDVGESITVEEALYGLMVASANEVAVALGERVSGTEEKFVALMNQRAAELGCQNTNFVTPNGLHDSNHYTCAYDIALICREIYKHPYLIKYMSEMNYHFEASAKQPDDFWILNTNDFLTGEIPCKDVVGGKTGYTDQARETLATFAERDGKKLICVIMREEPPYQYYDTVDLLDYGFDNFKQVNVSLTENRFTQEPAGFLSSGSDIFGNSTSPFSIRKDTMLMIPNSISFSDLTAEITPVPYETVSQETESGTSADKGENTQKTSPENTEDPDTGTTAAAAEESSAGSSQAAEGEAAQTQENTSADQIVKPEDPTKPATAQYTYTFAGWVNVDTKVSEIMVVTGDATYMAVYLPAEYLPQKKGYYNVVDGAGGEWREGGGDPFRFVFKRTVDDETAFDHFTGIMVELHISFCSISSQSSGLSCNSVFVASRPCASLLS